MFLIGENNVGKIVKEEKKESITICKYQNYLFEKGYLTEPELIDCRLLISQHLKLSKQIFLQDLYRKTLEIPGNIIELGCRYGSNLGLFMNLKNIFEPGNFSRKVIGFDTFEGFISIHKKDENSSNDPRHIKKGGLSVYKGYEEVLEIFLAHIHNNGYWNVVPTFDIIKGDVGVTLPKYFKDHPETIVSLAFFDLDIYEPTKQCLEVLLPHTTKGSIIAFDELNYEKWPGETLALKEFLDNNLAKVSLRRFPYCNTQAYFEVE